MDRKEAVQKLSKVARISVAYAEDLYDSFFPRPVVSQYVADWYEEIKDSFGYTLTEAINSIPVPIDGEELSDFEKWLLDDEQALTTLVNMHQFGYEVEKGTRYTVRFNNFKAIESYLKKDLVKQKYYLGDKFTDRSIILAHTRKELEANGFGWVFDCEGIQIEEVE